MSSLTFLSQPEKVLIGKTLEVPRMISGLWQLAGGHDKHVDLDVATAAMDSLISSGLDCFDMADHYGDAELVVGHHHRVSQQRMIAFTKWCPAENGIKTFQQAEEAVNLALTRMGQRQIALMQYHVWDYSDDTYIHNLFHLRTLHELGKIQHIGLTNVDAAHLELLLNSGLPIATNQVSCSVIDRRLVRNRLTSVCLEHSVKILAYGTLLGGFLSEKWLGQPEPTDLESLNWSLRKYLRFINAVGGWTCYQTVLQTLDSIARKHSVSIAAVATRHVLDLPAVGAVIVGSRLSTESDKYTTSNLSAFSFSLDEEDRALISNAQENLTDIPGDCGDEYRRAPYLTASGDLSHHLTNLKQHSQISKAIAEGKRIEYSSGSPWEPLASYSRAVRTGSIIRVSGTTANSPITSIPVLGGRVCEVKLSLQSISSRGRFKLSGDR
ncbi:alpha/keto reductase [Hyphodiscus hymeniophilus]|uniref:Alpha/keto reductase n=1 Tax=Hyphodiscus hymeniophilus TaxID=353542 RepID=A0A9P7AVY1_9HELO|nr:alpha/keto reductase [Hyphodiscus hymeniophilus]